MTDDISIPMWQCALCGATGQAERAAASVAMLDHIRTAHPDTGPLAASPPALRSGGGELWQLELEAKHGLPLNQIAGMVYALHYDPPRVVKSVSSDYAGLRPSSDSDGLLSAGPITHYVGWTQQARPRKRIGRHAPMGVTEIVHLSPGTVGDEQELKEAGQCRKCGEAYRVSLAERS